MSKADGAYPYIAYDAAAVSAWEERWEGEYRARWDGPDFDLRPAPAARRPAKPPPSQAVILELERFINDGRQLSVLPWKEET